MSTKKSQSQQIDFILADHIFDCAKFYLDTQDGKVKIPGKFDNGGRFYPNDSYDCCKGIRSPSRAFPRSLLTHCHSLQHIASMHKLEDHVAIIRKVANALKKGEYFKVAELLGSPKAKRFAVEKDLGI